MGWLHLSLLFFLAQGDVRLGSKEREAFALAPPERWTDAGGGPSGSGASAARPVEREPELRWSFGPLEFESEPLVWDERVLVTGRDPGGRRVLALLDRPSGRLLVRTVLSASVQVAPSWWDERVALRVAPARVEVYRLRGARFVPERSFAHETSLSAPLLIEDELFLREGDELVCRTLAQREPRWRAHAQGRIFRGDPVVRGERVFALRYDEQAVAHLVAVSRATGELLEDVPLGAHAGDGPLVPGQDASSELVVHARCAFVRLALPLRSTSGASLAWARVPREVGHLTGPATLHAFRGAPLELEDGWIALEELNEVDARWIHVKGGRELRSVVLADRNRHTWLTQARAPASRAGDVVHLGGAAVRSNGFEILWRDTQAPAFRPVPADGMLLVIEGTTLRALANPPPVPTEAEERAAALARELDLRQAEDYARLAARAPRTGDLALAERLVAEAEALGAEGRSLEAAERELERMRGSTRPPFADPRKVAALVEEERAIQARPLAELLRAVRASGAGPEARAHLWTLLERASDHAPALEELRARLPREAGQVGAQNALSWLELLDVAARVDIALTTAESSDAQSLEGKRLRAETEAWRSDLVGFRTKRLFAVAPRENPGAIARALEHGENVCAVLEEIFGMPPRDDLPPLELLIFPSREEYLEQSERGRSAPELALAWTAGHYSYWENLSRMFVPEDDRTHAQLLGVQAHELTHHWLAARSTFGALKSQPDQPGFWIVEGFATLIEELGLDSEQALGPSSFAPNPRAASLDTVANARALDLLPWERVLALSFEEFARLETRPTTSVSLTWRLGVSAERSPLQLFYAQAGALAHFLHHADGGRYRPLLLDAVATFYRGEPQRWLGTLGLSPEALGERVTAFARETVTLAPPAGD